MLYSQSVKVLYAGIVFLVAVRNKQQLYNFLTLMFGKIHQVYILIISKDIKVDVVVLFEFAVNIFIDSNWEFDTILVEVLGLPPQYF